MQVTIKIEAPEIASAIQFLANAIEGNTKGNISAKNAIATTISVLADVIESAAKGETTKPSHVEKNHEAMATEQEASTAQEESKEITIEDVRAAFMAKNSKSNTAKLKAILEKHGVRKVTDLKPEDFASVLSELEAI